jgi:hypothetical protein
LNIHLVVRGEEWYGEPGEKEDGNFDAKSGLRPLIVERDMLVGSEVKD